MAPKKKKRRYGSAGPELDDKCERLSSPCLEQFEMKPDRGYERLVLWVRSALVADPVELPYRRQ